MIFCKDCKWYRGRKWLEVSRLCEHPTAVRKETDLVDGTVTRTLTPASLMRSLGPCKESGELHEKR